LRKDEQWRRSHSNLDSIAEFRILTSNFDAEYGNYSGGQSMPHEVWYEQGAWRSLRVPSKHGLGCAQFLFSYARSLPSKSVRGTVGGQLFTTSLLFPGLSRHAPNYRQDTGLITVPSHRSGWRFLGSRGPHGRVRSLPSTAMELQLVHREQYR